ncbi:MAG: riboflavin synthase, partial [Rectinemataceae bacterium]|nr:riboflavin synthase [Rectinemataceae bacterium]
MFTGIVTTIGTLVKIEDRQGGKTLTIATPKLASFNRGSSVCCSGVCLTVRETTSDGFTADVSPETLSCTTIGDWREGDSV